VDADSFDSVCVHVLVEEIHSERLVCCFRLMPLGHGRDIGRSYSAQFYELSALEAFEGKMIEMGRFCVHPDLRDPDVLRVAWGAMAAYVDQAGVELLFGCTSFAGTDAKAYYDTFAMLKARHLAPKRWLPRVKAPDVFRFAARLRRKPDAKKALLRMPPLLRTYLLMGGWVSDHAVVDSHMNTLHVFTGVEIAAIPDARKRLLRAVAE
jgi:putative hemolysin